MCTGGGLGNMLNPDPSKHTYSLSGMFLRNQQKMNDLKDRLRVAKQDQKVPDGLELRAKGY